MQSADQIKYLEERILRNGEYFLVYSNSKVSAERMAFHNYVTEKKFKIRSTCLTHCLTLAAQLRLKGHDAAVTVGCSL